MGITNILRRMFVVSMATTVNNCKGPGKTYLLNIQYEKFSGNKVKIYHHLVQKGNETNSNILTVFNLWKGRIRPSQKTRTHI